MSTSLPSSVRVRTRDPWIDGLLQANEQFPLEAINLELESGKRNADEWRESIYLWIQVWKDIVLRIIETLRKEQGHQLTMPIKDEDIKLLEIAKDQIEPHLSKKLGNLEKKLIRFYKAINPTPVPQPASKIPPPKNNLQSLPEKTGTSDEAEKASGVEPQESIVTEQPIDIDCLLRAVKSVSPEVFAESLEDLTTAFYPPTFYPPTFYPPEIGKKLQGNKINRTFDVQGNAMEEIKQLNNRLGNDQLMEEIKQLNNRLMSTKVEICDKNDASITVTSFTKDSNARIVKCIFFNLSSLHSTSSSKHASENQCLIQPLKLKIPGTYPEDSPLVLDCSSALASGNMKDKTDLTGEAIAKLNQQLRTFEQPLSLETIAKTWDTCAHRVYREYAEQHGGGSFSSRYGTWKKVTDS